MEAHDSALDYVATDWFNANSGLNDGWDFGVAYSFKSESLGRFRIGLEQGHPTGDELSSMLSRLSRAVGFVVRHAVILSLCGAVGALKAKARRRARCPESERGWACRGPRPLDKGLFQT